MKKLNTFFRLFSSMNIMTLFRLALDYLYSKIFFPKSRIVRRPNYVRSEGELDIGEGFSSGPGLIIDVIGKNARIKIGRNVMAYHNLHIGAIDSVVIGDRVLIASGVYISDHYHGNYSGDYQSSPLEPPIDRPLTSRPVKIGDDVWIGERVSIMPGVSIGNGVVIGAGAIVTKDLPDYVIAVGAPAMVIKRYDFNKKVWTPEQ